jgi:hypothetical protein
MGYDPGYFVQVPIRTYFESLGYQVVYNNGIVTIIDPQTQSTVQFHEGQDCRIENGIMITDQGAAEYELTQLKKKVNEYMNSQKVLPQPSAQIKTESHLDLTVELDYITDKIAEMTRKLKSLNL